MSGYKEYWEGIEKELIQQITQNLTTLKDLDINKTDDSGTSLLHLCCHTGMGNLCKILIENKADINAPDFYKRTPIMIAAQNNFENIVEILLLNKAKLECLDLYGFNAVMHAIYAEDINIYKMLFASQKSEGRVDSYLGQMSSLALASSTGKLEIAKYIIATNPELVNEPVERTGMTPLMLAVCGNHNLIAELLIARGGSLQITSSANLSSVGYARKLAFPLLKLNIPSICIQEETKTPVKKKFHPLTPNLYISPIKRAASPKRAIAWIKQSVKRKRSKSVETRRQAIMENKYTQEDDNLLKSILHLSKMEQYWPLFMEQEINLKMFLTLSEDDLRSIGISKASSRLKLLDLIEHYKKIFNSK